MAKAAPKKSNKKPVSKAQASKVAQMMRGGNTMMKGMPKQPTPKQNPVSTYDDDADDNEQGA